MRDYPGWGLSKHVELCRNATLTGNPHHSVYSSFFQYELWSSFCTMWLVIGACASPIADHYLTDSQRSG